MLKEKVSCKIIRGLFLLVFFFTDIYCMDLHLTSWRDVKWDSGLHPMHKEVAQLAAKARYKIKGPTDSGNISIIGITVNASDGNRYFAHFGILSSALNSDGSKSDAVDTVQVVTVPDMLRGDPVFAVMGTSSSEVTRTHKLKAVLSYVGEDHKMHAKMESIRQAIDARITSNQKLDVVGTIGEKTPIQKDIGALLHCEQITLLKILDSKYVLLPIVMRLTEAVAASTIEGITLDIFTYNDMCENCFSTCDKQFNQLRVSITDLFRFAKKADETFAPAFNICISSFRPYQFGASLTRKLKDGYEPSSNIFDRAFCSVGNSTSEDPRIIQFVNPWIFGYLIQNELADIITAIGALKVEDLMKNIEELEKLTKRYREIKSLVDSKYDYVFARFGYDLATNHNTDLVHVMDAIITKRAAVRAKAEELRTEMEKGI